MAKIFKKKKVFQFISLFSEVFVYSFKCYSYHEIALLFVYLLIYDTYE